MTPGTISGASPRGAGGSTKKGGAPRIDVRGGIAPCGCVASLTLAQAGVGKRAADVRAGGGSTPSGAGYRSPSVQAAGLKQTGSAGGGALQASPLSSGHGTGVGRGPTIGVFHVSPSTMLTALTARSDIKGAIDDILLRRADLTEAGKMEAVARVMRAAFDDAKR